MIWKQTQKTSRPKYNMAQNSWFMIKLAWTAKEKKVLVFCLLTALLAVALNLINLYISPTVLSMVERHASVAELLWTIVGFTLALMAVSGASTYVRQNFLFAPITLRFEITTLLSLKTATTSYPNLDEDRFKNMLARCLNAVGSDASAFQAIWQTLSTLMTNLLGFIIYIGLLGSVQPLLVLVTLATTVINYFISNYLNGYGYRHREEESEYAKQIQYIITREKNLPAAKDIRIFGLRFWLEALYVKSLAAYMAFHGKAEGVYLWGRVVDLILTLLRNGIAYAYLIGLVIQNGLGVAEFLLFFTAISGFTQWVSGILNDLNTLHQQSLGISIVREFLEYDEPFLLNGGEPIRAEANRKYEIQLDGVSFRYPGAEADTLTNINLTLHPGEKLAVVGLNGAGKTTLVKLICGFLDPTQGRVLLDGKDIRGFNRIGYYTLFSAVFQDFSLLADTIAANVAQDDTDIDRDRVKACIEKAGLRTKVESLPGGYETRLNREVYEEAIQLSGGETQRLMLARALYKNAPFILLDEPTAALDPIAESDLYQKYNEMTGGRSSVYISHRLASTRFCDRIIMIENAGIIEEGTHEELLKRGGKYAQLYEVQSQYYQEGGSDHGE